MTGRGPKGDCQLSANRQAKAAIFKVIPGRGYASPKHIECESYSTARL